MAPGPIIGPFGGNLPSFGNHRTLALTTVPAQNHGQIDLL